MAEGVPFRLKGIGGSGAPHYFKFERRADAGMATVLIVKHRLKD